MIQGPEIFMILLVALVVLGPQRLPDTARKVGRWAAELRRAARELQAGLEAEVGDISEVKRQFQEPLQDVKQAVEEVQEDVRRAGDVEWVGEKPISGPTPEDAMADLAEIERTGTALTDEPTQVGGSPAPDTPSPASWMPVSGSDRDDEVAEAWLDSGSADDGGEERATE